MGERMKKKLKDVLSKDFIKGIEVGLQVANNISKNHGYIIRFPDINALEIEKDKKNKEIKNENRNKV
jgi:hypothetical protein